jgi:nicotinate-nucleotide adenylyltransferase
MTAKPGHERKKTRVAIYGGAFDPIHNGHLATIAAVIESGEVDKVVVVPSGDRPDKSLSADGTTRLELTRIAVQDAFPRDARVEVSDLHVERRVGYATIDLIEHFLKEGAEPFIVIGHELIGDLPRWRDPERLRSLANFIIIRRPGVKHDAVPEGLKARYLNTPHNSGVDVSSTTLRQMLKEGRSCAGLMPERVSALCRSRGVYR